MCDTMVALGETTADGVTLFGKNSDRQRNEAQRVEIVPASTHGSDTSVACTYLSVPQASRTYTALISRPFWMWGAEMGANENGVIIGNEGLLSCLPEPVEPALTGMDLVRLALERATTAGHAVDTITELLETYGQGGNCGHLTPAFYHNGFLIADEAEAFVLETIGRDWVVERVKGARAISNGFSIATDFERQSATMEALLASCGGESDQSEIYAQALADPRTTHIGSAGKRRARAASLLAKHRSVIELTDVFAALRDHDTTGGIGNAWDPKRSTGHSLCVHAGAAASNSQTTGSLVSSIGRDAHVHWVTGTAAPCLSIFKPLLLDTPVPAHGLPPGDLFDAKSLWWRHEQLHRAAIRGDFALFLQRIAAERDALEASFEKDMEAVMLGGSKADHAYVVEQCWAAADDAEARWHLQLPPRDAASDSDFERGWRVMDEAAGLIHL